MKKSLLKKIYKPGEITAPFYQRYIDLVPDDGNLLIHLEDIFSELVLQEDTEKIAEDIVEVMQT